MNKKQLYEAPEAELLEVKIEENFMGSRTGEDGNPKTPFNSRSRVYYYDDEEDLY